MTARATLIIALLSLSLTPLHAEVDFARDIRPILNAHCVACHGGVKEAGDVSFIYREKALGNGESGKTVIVPRKPDDSEMMVRILSTDPSEVMPKPAHGPPLPKHEVALLKQWIAEGAKWREHWAFVPPIAHAAPELKQTSWPRREMDRFILARLEKEGLQPSKEADKAALLRRVSLDLTGLPPTEPELDAFLADDSTRSYEKQVQRLLNSPRFGERWASVWMDLARYADSEGLGQDHRRDVWKYRDWLIAAFNNDMPYDQFTIAQLAGDLLPQATLDDRIATTFHRLTQANNEGGTDDEEFRVTAVMDRVATTWEVWQGVTMGCVQCHAHPYDPIQHKEYYDFMAFFNNTEDADTPEGLPVLTVPLDTKRHAEAGHLQARIAQLETAIFEKQLNLATSTEWYPTIGMKATATKAVLEVVKQEQSEEFRTAGNVAAGAVFTLDTGVDPKQKRITAMRVEVLPVDEAKALHTPEWGTLLKRIRLERHTHDDHYADVPLAEVITDEPHPLFNPNDSISSKGARRGWGPYTKMNRPRHAIVVLREPIEVSESSQLRVTLAHTDFSAGGSFPLITKRGRISFTDDERWEQLGKNISLMQWKSELAATQKKLRAIPSTTTPDMRELPSAQGRATHLFIRGNWLDKGERIEHPGTPQVFPAMKGNPDRLSMARWIVSPANPLTARVAVNRFWLELFGTGIVPTPEDFGSAGEKPTHPELLDTLAVRFQTSMRWSVKSLLRELVTSATYRQDARVSPALAERDPDNRLLARGPRQRLTGEMVRDHALMVAGLLVNKTGGKPVHPPLPEGVWKPFDGDKWTTPKEGDAERYRRAVYTYWKRSIPFPMFATFDAPTRELCSKRRVVSNTPLQALSVLNDPAFHECAKALGRRMQIEFTGSIDERLAHAYREVTTRNITAAQLVELKALFTAVRQQYADQPAEMQKVSTTPEGAAYTVLASVLLNLDEALIR
ncbi:PSD1 and planctomycete cytochrome C domain-containing protein [Roseimicrobium gellanilyticum]|uniref:PSD1 and planctomycete cytochrome C domain-containing protein n=1 Tax=Roseimicrobium gellanilyticum TaxID=748857 RepID=UPI0014745FDB|nr:PSD1 and planctomycete cytochrome C domain-containing protein [Roseimicrobium gellanilyticum]